MAIVQADWLHKQAVHVTAPGWGAVATVNLDPALPLLEQQRANLRLIAAAPDLLELLQEAVSECSIEFVLGTEWLRKAAAAIAKATGSQQ